MKREPAIRLFGEEYNSATLVEEGEGDQDPNHLITPLGSKVNRLLISGVLTEVENRGTEKEPNYLAKVSDPSSSYKCTYFIYAGQYQPQAMAEIQELEPPCFISVVGKMNSYQPDEETFLTSVRAESVKVVTEKERDQWVIDAVKATKERIDLVEYAQSLDEVDKEKLIEEGFDKNMVEGYMKAREHYNKIPVEDYKDLLEDSLRKVHPLMEDPQRDKPDKPEKDEHQEALDKADENEEQKNKLVKMIKDIEGQNGVDWDKAQENAEDRFGIDGDTFEELINELRSNGRVYEPALGRVGTI